MQRYLRWAFAVVAALIIGPGPDSYADVKPQRYGVSWSPVDSAVIARSAMEGVDSLLKAGPLKGAVTVHSMQPLRASRNLTGDFYLLTGLCLILGLIRYGDPRYFSLLLGAYRTGSSRQWRDLLQAAAVANLGMNIFFCAVAGAYIYYIAAGASVTVMGYGSQLLLPVLIIGMMLMYAGKYLVIRFSGWVFRVEALAGEYLFNVFLVNKIIGIVLLPFVVIIAFAGREWLQPMAILSGTVVLGLMATRYLRSWSVFYTFFKGSRFHFFTYLCASEILPMAVLVKCLLRLMS